jgi:purine-binding chemotaxis protein CheW
MSARLEEVKGSMEYRAGDETLKRIICFSIGEEEYGIPLLDVKEVIALPEITPVPYTPPHFLGIMNLRGNVISIIDLRTKFKIKPKPDSETTVVICDFDNMNIGVVVDSVNTVVSPHAGEISAKPEIQSQIGTDYITAVLKRDARLIILLDVAKTLGAEDFAAMNKASKIKKAA